jgi:phosphoserine phosphatase
LLQAEGCEVAIASITWSFAVAWFAEQLDVRHHLGTKLLPTGEVEHVWGRDKARWFTDLADRLEVPGHRRAAVGDSPSDAALLQAASIRIYVGPTPPPALADVVHMPGANLRVAAERVLREWGTVSGAPPGSTSGSPP